MKRTIKFIFLIIFIWIALSMGSKVNAATATIKANKTSATVGDSVKVTVTVNAAAWNLNVTGSASGSIIGYNADAENQKTTKTYTIDTSKAGTYKVTLSGDVTDESKDSADIVNKSVTINVKDKTTSTTNKTSNTTTKKDTSATNTKSETSTKKETTTKTKSSNAYLSTLGVTPKEYDFSGFTKTKTSYSVTVPSDVDSLKVAYKTADKNATVKVSGNTGFDVGTNNKIRVVVTAEDGKTTKTYTIKVTKLAEDEEKEGNLIEDDTGLCLTSLEIEGVELSPEFSKDVYSYTATLNKSDVSDLKVEAKANNKKANIDISGNNGLVEGENTINIILTLEGSSNQKVYQVVVNKETTTGAIAISTENTPAPNNDLVGNIKGIIKIIIAVIIFIILAVIVLIVLLRKENKRLKGEGNKEKDILDKFEDDSNYTDGENLIETLYKQKNESLYNEEDLSKTDRETLEEINKQTEEIFREKVKGQSVEYTNNDLYENNPLEERNRRRTKGKHSK